MIERYSVAEISEIWSEENRFLQFLKVESALSETLYEENIIPCDLGKDLSKVKIHLARIKEIERVTKHDVLAFCQMVEEQLSDEKARFFHFGVTSSDIIDTATFLMIKQTLGIIEKDLQTLIHTVEQRSKKDKAVLTVGRSHGRNAEPMTWGRKWQSFLVELQRRQRDLTELTKTEMYGQFSGAIGNYLFFSSQVEEKVCQKLGLSPEVVSTQVIPRDRYTKIIMSTTLLALALERMAENFRLLQHSGVDEAFEGFSSGQKGSSIMPHKKNPVSSENICGLCRVLKSHLFVAMDNTSLWHERDLAHSSSERMYLPDHFGLLSYVLRRMNNVVKNLVINKDQAQLQAQVMASNHSSFYLHQLLVKTNLSRHLCYQILQRCSFATEQDRAGHSFANRIQSELLDLGVTIELEEFSLESFLHSKTVD